MNITVKKLAELEKEEEKKKVNYFTNISIRQA